MPLPLCHRPRLSFLQISSRWLQPWQKIWRQAKTLLLLSLTATVISPADAASVQSAPHGHWQMIMLRGVPQVDPTITTLDIDNPKRISGNTGCNHYQAKIIGSSESLFGKLSTTDKACPPPTDAQEQGFLKVMKQAASWSMGDGGDRLVLRDDAGKPLAIFIPRQDPEYYFACGNETIHIVMNSRREISLTISGRTHLMEHVEGGGMSDGMKRFAGDGLKFQARGRKGRLTTQDGRRLDCHLVAKPAA